MDAELTAGFRWPGGVIALLVALPLLGRMMLNVNAGTMGDLIAPAFGFGMATVRIGCLLAGCCFGAICDLPWKIRFPKGSQPWAAQLAHGLIGRRAESSLPVHPLQVYFGLWSLMIGLVLYWYLPRRKHQGQVFLLFVALQGGGKFGLEYLRFERIPAVQLASLVLAGMAAIALGIMRRVEAVPAPVS